MPALVELFPQIIKRITQVFFSAHIFFLFHVLFFQPYHNVARHFNMWKSTWLAFYINKVQVSNTFATSPFTGVWKDVTFLSTNILSNNKYIMNLIFMYLSL